MNRIVIVGAGLAAHRAAQALRREGFAGDLVIVGDEAHRPYDRPPLSKQVLAGSMTHEDCFFAPADLDVEWMLGHAATGLDAEAQVVQVGDRLLPYDGLIIATGRRARPWPELPRLDGFHTLRSLDDVHALRAAVRPGARAAIVGAGFIGCEVAATLRGLGVEDVTVIDVAPHPMPVLGPEVGARARALHERHGVRFRLSSGVERFEGTGCVEAIRLTDGERIEADFVLLALGSVPNSEWLDGSGIELHRGAVLCDEHCFAAGVENVVVAGDVAAYPHPFSDGPVSIEHWSNAREMGPIAALNLLGGLEAPKRFAAVPTVWSDQYDVKIKTAGLLAGADRYTVIDEDPAKQSLVVEAHREGDLVGAIAFNRNRTIIEYQRRLAEALSTSRPEPIT